MATAFQAPRRHCCPARPQPAEGTPTPPLEAPELTAKSGSITCVVTAPFSWAMVHTGFCCAFQESLSQSCESSGISMVGLMVTSSKRAYARPRSTAPRAPAPSAVHCCLISPQETLKHSSGSVSVGSLCPGGHKVCFRPLNISSGYGI